MILVPDLAAGAGNCSGGLGQVDLSRIRLSVVVLVWVRLGLFVLSFSYLGRVLSKCLTGKRLVKRELLRGREVILGHDLIAEAGVKKA